MWRLWSWDAMVPSPSLANENFGGGSNLNNLHDDYGPTISSSIIIYSTTFFAKSLLLYYIGVTY